MKCIVDNYWTTIWYYSHEFVPATRHTTYDLYQSRIQRIRSKHNTGAYLIWWEDV